MEAGHPNYDDQDDIYGPDDFDAPTGGGTGIVFDSLLSVPVVITAVALQASTVAGAKEGSQFAVVHGRVLDDVKRVQTKDDGDPIDLAFGDEFSTSIGSRLAFGFLRQLAPGGKKENAVGRVVVRAARVPNDNSPGKKQRQYVVAERDEAASLLARLAEHDASA